MLYRMALLLESFAIIICIHRLYNKRPKLDIETVGVCLLSLGILEFVVCLELNHMITASIYVVLVVYSIHKFDDTAMGALISVLLMIVVITVLQFLFAMPSAFLFPENQELRMLLTNLLVAVFVLWVLPVAGLHHLRMVFGKRDIFIKVIFCIVFMIALMIMIEGKMTGQINLTSFALAIPTIVALFWALNKWSMEQEEKERMECELSATKIMQEKYDDLLTSVRLREHGFKNHIAALLAIKYTNESLEELEKEQEKYYKKIREANKYNKLLFLGNRVVSGYLYQKFCDAENVGVTVIYEMKGHFVENTIPVYHLIEILGVFIDNAIEAQADLSVKKWLKIQFEERENDYCFKVSNPYRYIEYAEMEDWFAFGNSKKGEGRGLGLYYVKSLCEDYGMDILCRNVECEQENWIEFTLEIKKADEA